MSRVLVTGATGFIGRHLVRALTGLGHSVTCLVRRSSRISPLGAFEPTLVYGDVSDRATLAPAVEGVDAVVHLAGTLFAFSERDFLAVNRAGCCNVAEACAARAEPPVLVLVSSMAASGPSPDDAARLESDPPRPVSDYGRSKLAGERAAAALADRVPLTIVRPPVVFGPGDRHFFTLFESVARGWHAIVARQSGHRVSLVHVEDLARFLVTACERGERLPAGRDEDPGRGVYFPAFDVAPTWEDLGVLLGRALDVPDVRTVRVPDALAWLIMASGDLWGRVRRRPGLINLDKLREGNAGSWILSTAKAREQLGFAPRKSLAERLRETGAWYRRGGWL